MCTLHLCVSFTLHAHTLTRSHSHARTYTHTHTGGIRNCGIPNSTVLSWEGCDYSILIKFQDYEGFIILQIPVSQNYRAISHAHVNILIHTHNLSMGVLSCGGGGEFQKLVFKPGFCMEGRGIKTA